MLSPVASGRTGTEAVCTAWEPSPPPFPSGSEAGFVHWSALPSVPEGKEVVIY